MSEFFEPALEDLVDALPSHWATSDPKAELARILQAIAEQQDELAADFEAIHADQALVTATDGGLRNEWALLYGASSDVAGFPDTEQLREYLQARASEDGTVGSLEDALLAVLRTPANDVGTPLTFPADGSPITYDAHGQGPLLFEATIERGELVFPPDGSGLTFPADGSPITMPTPGRLTIVEHYSDPRIEVRIRDVLAYDANALARAAERFRQAHHLPVLITPVVVP